MTSSTAASASALSILGFPLTSWLGLSVVAAFISTLGSFTAILIKDIWAAGWFEDRKAKRSIEDAYRKYQLPIFSAASDLRGRLFGLARTDNDRKLQKINLKSILERRTRPIHAKSDHHYLRYRFLSNVYRLCAFLGWIELYRRDSGSMNADLLGISKKFNLYIEKFQSALADGFLNEHNNWDSWRDCLLFREELKAIGQSMILQGERLEIIDYGSFVDAIETDPEGAGRARWFIQAASFYEDLRCEDPDFRVIRIRMMVVHLTGLLNFLQPGRVPREQIETAATWSTELDSWAGGVRWRRHDTWDSTGRNLFIPLSALARFKIK